MREHSNVWMSQVAWRGAEIAAAWAANPPAPGEAPTLTARELARYIDHTLLKAEATPAQVEALCAEAAEHGFASVCVNSSHVALCAERLQGSGVAVGSTVGFPLGAMLSAAKAQEAGLAIEAGANEIDMVLPVGLLKAGDLHGVYEDIAAVVRTCHAGGALCKVIFETALLADAEKATACLLCAEAGADYVKTSTGFGPGGATVADVALMRHVVGPTKGVKAAGGIRTYADALAMIAAGATRIGASAGIQILQGIPQ
jgi:deoxyribose-phosphate aldolase